MTSPDSHPLPTMGNELPTPSTPNIPSASLPDHTTPTSVAPLVSRVDKGSHISPAPPSSSEMTPPPSSQLPPRAVSPIHHELPATALLVSPPATLKQSVSLSGLDGCNRYSNATLPSAQQIAKASEDELRDIITEIIPALGEARMSCAHYKLQHQLLSIETSESAMRAAVEHEMTRREVDVLQKPDHRRFDTLSSLAQHRTAPGPSPSLVDITLQRRCAQLEKLNASVATRFRRAKKMMMHQESKNLDLAEDNQRLRQRIRENREHINQIRSSGTLPVASTTRNDSIHQYRKSTPRFSHTARPNASLRGAGANRQDPFAALLAADQVLNGESVSVPSTPIHSQTSRLHLGHTRGTHSLSSLPTTPARLGPVIADSPLFTPVNRITLDSSYSHSAPPVRNARVEQERDREERDSTISASDNEDEAYTDDDIPQSQASQAATHMLRRSPTRKAETIGTPSKAINSSTLMQGKLFGQVRKAGVTRYAESKKRKVIRDDAEGDANELKRSRMSEGVGLGIGHWGSPVA